MQDLCALPQTHVHKEQVAGALMPSVPDNRDKSLSLQVGKKSQRWVPALALDPGSLANELCRPGRMAAPRFPPLKAGNYTTDRLGL